MLHPVTKKKGKEATIEKCNKGYVVEVKHRSETQDNPSQ